MGNRTDLWVVTLSLKDPATDETRNLGEWDQKTGGEVDSEENVYTASRGRRVSLGGNVNVGNLVLTRNYELARDHTQLGWILGLVGRGEGAISQAPTNIAFVVKAGAIGYIGTLKRCTPPEVDSTSNDPATIELEFTIANAPKVA